MADLEVGDGRLIVERPGNIMRRAMWAVCILALSFAALAVDGQPSPAGQRTLAYEELMKLGDKERESSLLQMPPAERLRLKRTHAQRWLEKNRASLTPSQVAVAQEAIDFISPERYRDLSDPELMKQEAEIAHRLACSLGEERAVAAFTFREIAPPSSNRPWSDLLDSWAQWLVECVIR
jgi:hypothetical protein